MPDTTPRQRPAEDVKIHRPGREVVNVDADAIAQMRAGGYKDDEIFAWIKTAEAATACLALGELHQMEREEVCHSFHQIQNYLLGRVGMRVLGRKEIPREPKDIPLPGDAGNRTSEGKGLTSTGHEEPTEAEK